MAELNTSEEVSTGATCSIRDRRLRHRFYTGPSCFARSYRRIIVGFELEIALCIALDGKLRRANLCYVFGLYIKLNSKGFYGYRVCVALGATCADTPPVFRHDVAFGKITCAAGNMQRLNKGTLGGVLYRTRISPFPHTLPSL